MIKRLLADWKWRKAQEYQGRVRHISHTNNNLVGKYSLLLVDDEKGYDTKPVIFYDTQSHGRNEVDLANPDIKEGDLVRFTLNTPLSDREKSTVGIYCPKGFLPVFTISHGLTRQKAT